MIRKMEDNKIKNYTEINKDIENKLDFLLSHNKNYTKNNTILLMK